jgi:hypothetical protein
MEDGIEAASLGNDEAVAGFIDDPASATTTELAAQYVSSEPVISDTVWTWWFSPIASYDTARQRVTLAGVSSTGVAKLATIDLRRLTDASSALVAERTNVVVMKQQNADDHDVGAVLVTDDHPVLALSTNHGRDPYVSLFKSLAPHDIGSLQPETQLAWSDDTSYGHFIRKPGTDIVMVLLRGGVGGSGWFSRVSTDPWATSPSWAAEQRTWGGSEYGCQAISADGTSRRPS